MKNGIIPIAAMKIQPNRRAASHRAGNPVHLIRVGLTMVALAAFVVAALSGCSGAPGTPAASRPSTPTRQPQPTTPPTTPQASEADGMTLTWWTPEFLSTQAPGAAGKVLADQVTAFEKAQGGPVRVETMRKARFGKGGLLDALRTAQPVAVNTLPDIVALDVTEVEKAVTEGLLQPLDGLIDTSVIEGLYPFASEAGTFDQHLYAIQLAADVEHAAFLPSQMAEAPSRWEELLARRTAYLFPLASARTAGQVSGAAPSESLSHAVLSQYLSAGATLGPDRRLVLEPQPLLELLQFYADAGKTSVLPASARDLSDDEDVWEAFSRGQAPLAYVSARRFLAPGDLKAGFAAAPGHSGPAPSVAGGWALAIVTRDPERQRKAAELITWLLRPENAGAWAKGANWLPTSSDALAAFGSGPYWTFLDDLLSRARSVPSGPDTLATAARIEAAIEAVVRNGADPAAAASAAAIGEP